MKNELEDKVFVPGGTPEEMISFMEEKIKNGNLTESLKNKLRRSIKSMCQHKETYNPVRHESGAKLTRCKKCGDTW